MPDWSLMGGGSQYDTVGENLSTSLGAAVACGLNNTEGNWVELSSSTPIAATGFVVFVGGGLSGNAFLFDIGIGASTAEKAIFEDICYGTRGPHCTLSVFIPIPIPAGTRLCARARCTSPTALNLQISVTLLSSHFPRVSSLNRATVYGATTSDSGGIGMDPGGTINTKNSWVEIVASTTYPIRELIICTSNGTNSTRADCGWILDIGIGASTAEKVIIPDIFLGGNGTTDMIHPQIIGPIPCDIPAGTRIAGKCQCSINDAADRLFDVILVGLD